MLLSWAKVPADETKANEVRRSFPRHGNEGITIENFMESNMTFVGYTLMGRKYSGYFTKDQVNDLFFILDYFEGEILCLNG